MNEPLESNSPPLSREALIAAIAEGFTPKWVHFWGHTPPADGSVGKTCFSQWWAGHPFTVDGVAYATAEHFMMAEKARLFGDAETLAEILAVEHPNAAKKLGRKVRDFDDGKWLAARWNIVVRGNHAKFSQHADLADFLINTGDRIIVEASPYDSIWGVGLAVSDPRVEQPECWRGLNLLGFALMDVRGKLRGETQSK